MRINAEMDRPVTVDTANIEWSPSPSAGVDRRMLFRIGDEVARATSIVRYAPGSRFPSHVHTGGEEILVLDGTFQDEHGDYPAGSYFRNPPGTSHAPAAADGCTIFVRLWQFRQGDDRQIVVRLGQGEPAAPRDGGRSARVLFRDQAEEIRLEEWLSRAAITVSNPRGLEFLVTEGSVAIDGVPLGPQGWGRLPAGTDMSALCGSGGATVWLRDGPLLHPDVLAIPE